MTPTSNGFGNQKIGTTSSATQFTLKNTGTATLTVNSVGIATGDTGSFSQTNNCGAALAPGANCTINVTFSPTSAGPKSSALKVAATNVSDKTSALTGNGTTPIADLDPDEHDFGDIAPGSSSSPVPFTLTNSGDAALDTIIVALNGTNASSFSQTNNCGASLAVGASCDINVTYSPMNAGTKNATLDVTSDAAPASATLTGATDPPSASLAPADHPFGSQPIADGPTTTQTFTLTNTSATNPLTISSAPALAGTDPGDFQTSHNTCTAGTTVGPGNTCTVDVAFDPTDTGPREANLQIDTSANDPTSGITGTGTKPEIEVDPDGNDFGPQPIAAGPTAAVPFDIENPGTAPLTVNGIQLSGANQGDFVLDATGCGRLPTQIAAGDQCSVTVQFNPSETGGRSAQLDVHTNAADPDPFTVALDGTGTAPAVTADPLGHGFGEQVVDAGPTSPQPIEIQNPGTAPLTINTIQLSGADSGDFTLDASGCGTLPGTGGAKVNRATASSPNAKAAKARRAVRVPAGQTRGGGVTG